MHASASRVWVVGTSGSGKSTFARRLALARGATYVELDAFNHLADWEQRSAADMTADVLSVLDAATNGWVVDGTYRSKLGGTVLDRADTVVWLDLPRSVVMRAVTARTIRRLVRREVLWNGNRERLRNVLSVKPEDSILVWAWTTYAPNREKFATLAAETPGLHWVHVHSRAEADAALRALAAR